MKQRYFYKNQKKKENIPLPFNLVLENFDNVIGHEMERTGIHMGLGLPLNPATGVPKRREKFGHRNIEREHTRMKAMCQWGQRLERCSCNPRNTRVPSHHQKQGKRQGKSLP